jgi:hypothetical protein
MLVQDVHVLVAGELTSSMGWKIHRHIRRVSMSSVGGSV